MAFTAAAVVVSDRSVPAPVNWVLLAMVAPLLVIFFSHLRRLRNRSSAMAEESRRLHFVVDRASDWIFLTDDSGAIQYTNRTACAQLGFSSEELKGKSIAELTSEPQRNVLRELVTKCRDQAIPPAEVVFERRDGAAVSVEIGCTAIASEGTRILHFAGRDITERKAIDRRLREARQWEGLGSLAGGVAHDFNNLLTSIMGNASLAKEMLAEGHPVAGLLQSIVVAGESSAELVRMMLATSGYRPRYREILRVDEILIKLLSERPLPANVICRTNAEPAVIESDVRSVEMLLWSLIANGADSYGTRGGEVSVSVRCAKASETGQIQAPQGADFEDGAVPTVACISVVVEDSGCGMKPEVLERAFDPFFTTKFTGRGLGLPAVRGIVRAHAGKLWLRSRPLEGTRVEVWLPCTRYDGDASAS
jgi:PAS domain S-box-containing protein